MTENIRHHEEGLRLFLAGRAAESVAFFEAALQEQESSIRWNDWATAVLACGHPAEAEQGYRRALALDSQNGQASVNLGVMLMRQKRIPEAVSGCWREALGCKGIKRAQAGKAAELAVAG